MKIVVFLLWLATGILSAGICHTQNFDIGAEDIRLEPDISSDGQGIVGFHLYIRKTNDINSVLLTETTKDPDGIESNYAYRASEWNAMNGDEIRMLNGQRLVSEYARFSIIDSTPEEDTQFGMAFHLYIPMELVFGYPWTRNGTVHVGVGTFVNIRAFGAKYGDYSKGFGDNPFMFDMGERDESEGNNTKQPTVITDRYNSAAATNFASIAKSTDGTLIYSDGPTTLVHDIIKSIEKIEADKPADIVLAVDATGSMKDDIQQLRSCLAEDLVDAIAGRTAPLRIGLLLYRDYNDTFRYNGLPVKIFPFTTDVSKFEESLNSFNIYGTEGGDIPEAVYEALFAAMEFYPWNKTSQKKIILIGDAEAHPRPRGTGKYTKELVEATSLAWNITIDTIIIPDGKTGAERGK